MKKNGKSWMCAALAGILWMGGLVPAGSKQEDRITETEGIEDTGEVLIQAHAGASSIAPENTMAAFRAAKEIGADGIETDVRMTKDHHLVLHHDNSIDNTSDGSGYISQMTLEELKACDFGSWFGQEYAGEKILTLEECLTAAEELDFSVLNLELKPVSEDAEGFVHLAADTIQASPMADRVMVCSFDSQLLKELKAYAPEIHVAMLTIPDLSILSLFNLSVFMPKDKPLRDYTMEDVARIPEGVASLLRSFGAKGNSKEEILLETIADITAVVPVNTTWNELEEMIEEQSDLVSFVDGLGFSIDSLNCHFNSLSSKLMDAMEERGITVNVWTPDKEWELKKVLSFNPAGIITNEPETALEIREGKSVEL